MRPQDTAHPAANKQEVTDFKTYHDKKGERGELLAPKEITHEFPGYSKQATLSESNTR